MLDPGIPVVTNRFLTETVERREPYRLPHCRVRTRSVQKAFKRARRRQTGFRTVWVTVPSKAVYQIGGQLVMHPETWERVKAGGAG